MKNTFFLFLFFLTTLAFAGKKYEDQVIERITCPTQKCEEGQTLDIEIPSMMEETAAEDVVKVELSEGSEHIVKMLNSGEGGQMIFEPAVIKVSVGDTIHFKATDAAHNSVSVDGMVPAGAASWASQLSQDISVTWIPRVYMSTNVTLILLWQWLELFRLARQSIWKRLEVQLRAIVRIS